MTLSYWQDMIEAKELEHRVEVNRLKAKLALYRMALEDAGIQPPDGEAADVVQLWRDTAAVIDTTSTFVERLGSAKELIGRMR